MAAHGTDLDGLTRRARQWYYSRKSDYKRVKLTAKARYVEMRARLAANRGDDAAARRYRSKALNYRRMLHHPGQALENVVALSKLERERGLLDDAGEYLAEGRQICAEVDPTPELREEVVALADAYEERGDSQEAAEWYFTTIYLSRVADPHFERDRPKRHRRYLEMAEGPDTTANCYDLGLRNVLYGDEGLAVECLAAASACREELSRRHQQYQLAFAAGAGLLALEELGVVDLDDSEREELQSDVADERDRLSRPAGTLFDVVDGAEVDHAGFDTDADPRGIRVNLGQLEEAAYGTLLERLDS